MGQRWYYHRDGREIGPLTSDELRRLAAAGVLKPEDNVRRTDSSRWIKATEIKRLFPESRSVSPPARRLASAPATPTVATPARAAVNGWYLHRGGQTYGPYPDEQLKEMARLGEILAEDQICAEGTTEWLPAATALQMRSGPPPFVPPQPSAPPAVPVSVPVPRAGPPKFPVQNAPRAKAPPAGAPPPFLPAETAPGRGTRVHFRTGLHWKTLLLPWLTLLQSAGSIFLAIWWYTRNLNQLADQQHIRFVVDAAQQMLNVEEIRGWLWIAVYVVIGLNMLWFVLRLIRFLRTSFVVTERGIVARQGIFFVWPVETSWDDLRVVQVAEPFLGGLLGYGTISLAGESGTREYRDVWRARQLKFAADRHRAD